MRILGIDPSLHGFGIVIINDKMDVVFKERRNIGKDCVQTRKKIREHIESVISLFEVELVAVESPAYGFKNKFVSTHEILCAMVEEAAFNKNVKCKRVSPMKVKSIFGGKTKDESVMVAFERSGIKMTHDEADAFHVACAWLSL